MADESTEICSECGRDRGNREPHRRSCSRRFHYGAALSALHVGDLVKFTSERQRYRVKAANERFAVCTKPMNALRTTIYSIIDFERNVRGRENLIFGMGFETDEQCAAALKRLVEGESQVSYRHCTELDIEKVDRC